MKERRLEILGILLVTVSLLIFISFLGYNSNEDPGISPNVKIENPLGILGLWISYYFIKIGFGYMSFVLPLLGIIWGIWFFTHKDFDAISRLSGYSRHVQSLFRNCGDYNFAWSTLACIDSRLLRI